MSSTNLDNYNEAENAANREWDGVLTRLWTGYGTSLDAAQLKVYHGALANMSLGVLEHVIDETIRRHRLNTVPILAEIFDIINEYHPDYQAEVYIHTRIHRGAA